MLRQHRLDDFRPVSGLLRHEQTRQSGASLRCYRAPRRRRMIKTTASRTWRAYRQFCHHSRAVRSLARSATRYGFDAGMREIIWRSTPGHVHVACQADGRSAAPVMTRALAMQQGERRAAAAGQARSTTNPTGMPTSRREGATTATALEVDALMVNADRLRPLPPGPVQLT